MVPTLRFWLWVGAGSHALRGATLDVRLQIHAERRRYGPGEAVRLRELFGAPEDFPRLLGPVPWTQTTLVLGPFEHETVAELRVPCTYDFDVAAAKYLTALGDGEVPLELLFSGTMMWSTADGRLQSARISWDSEASVRMPVAVWHAAMREAFGDTAWLRVDRDVFTRLQEYRSLHGCTSWGELITQLLEAEKGG